VSSYWLLVSIIPGELSPIPANLLPYSHIPRIHAPLEDPMGNPEKNWIEAVVYVDLTAVG
jgi:hypothetical protein